MFNLDKPALADTRIQLHWASQLLAAVAAAKLDKEADFSHTNLGWDSSKQSLDGRAGVSIDVPTFALSSETLLPLSGVTLADAKARLEAEFETTLDIPDYEMPEHPTSATQPFNPDSNQLGEIASWFSFALEVLEPHGDNRIWPHHFDMGFWNPGEVEGKSIGGGFTLGDEHINQPYFYVNPYGVDRPQSLPKIDRGNWTDAWFGMVLTGEEIINGANAAEFLSASMTLASAILAN